MRPLTARLFAATCAAPVALLAQSTSAPSTATYPSVLSYRTVEVARGVIAFITPEERTGLQAGNSIAVIGEDAVLVFDAGAIPSTTRQQIAEIRRRTSKPVTYLINSHWHPDHTLANAEYQRAFPGIRIIGTVATKQGITDRAAGFQADVKGFAQTDSLMRLRLNTGKMRDGSPMPPRVRTMFELNTRDFAEFGPEVASATPLTSTETFSDSLVIDLGRRRVVVRATGRGNTAGDAIVRIPDVKVVLTGDLVTVPCPFPSTAYFGSWVAQLDTLLAANHAVYVPGHGEPQRDQSYLRLTRDLIQFTITAAREAVQRGTSAEDFAKQIPLDDWRRRFAGDDVVRTEAFNNFFASEGPARAYLEAKLARKGEFAPPYPG